MGQTQGVYWPHSWRISTAGTLLFERTGHFAPPPIHARFSPADLSAVTWSQNAASASKTPNGAGRLTPLCAARAVANRVLAACPRNTPSCAAYIHGGQQQTAFTNSLNTIRCNRQPMGANAQRRARRSHAWPLPKASALLRAACVRSPQEPAALLLPTPACGVSKPPAAYPCPQQLTTGYH